MTTIKVKFRQSTVDGKEGTLFIQLIHNRETRLITTKIKLFSHEWDKSKQKIVVDSNDIDQAVRLLEVQRRLNEEIGKIKNIIMTFEKKTNYTTADVITSYMGTSNTLSFFAFIQKRALTLQATGHKRTAETYNITSRVFLNFVNNPKLSFADITPSLMKDFEEHLLARRLARNTTSFYMRILRTVYKRGVMKGFCNDCQPFKDVYTGIDKTDKRAIDENVIERLKKLENIDPKLAFARDMFLFSFYTRGMSFVDIFYLKEENIVDGILTYKRIKTKQPLSIRIEPCIGDIIRKYSSEVKKSPYLFPLAKPNGDLHKQQCNALRLQNNRLKQLSELLGLRVPLTSYVSRHTWASIAKQKGISISIISEGMGHTSVATTQIYLASFEQEVIDAANLSIIGGTT